jgi:hypothetical protein
VIHVLGGLVWAGRNEAGSRKGKGVVDGPAAVDRSGPRWVGWGGVRCGAVVAGHRRGKPAR